MRNDLTNTVIQYIESLYGPQEPWLNTLHERLSDQRRFIQLGRAEARLLQILVTLHQPQIIIEIGTLAGYSALVMAQSLPPLGRIITFESTAEHAHMAREHFETYPGGDRITLIEGDAHEQLLKLPLDGLVDMVFIDADKGGYPHYLVWAKQHLRPGGLLVADNTLLFGSVIEAEKPRGVSRHSYEAMQAFNKAIATPHDFMSVLIPTPEGLTVAIKK